MRTALPAHARTLTKTDDTITTWAMRDGARDAFGVPAAVLGAGYIGYGALAAENGYSVWLTMIATGSI